MEINLSKDELQKLIDVKIKASIMEALGKDPDKVIETVVTQALSEKKDSWSRETKFQSAINEMIREVAKDTFSEWIESKKDVVRKAILKRVNKEEGQLFEDLAQQLVEGLSKSFYVSCTLKVENQD